MIDLRGFDKDQLKEATHIYDEEEQQYREDKNKDLVLVSADSSRDMQKGYRNYFSDTDAFIRNLERVYEANGAILPKA